MTDAPQLEPSSPPGRRLTSLAFILLIACVAARPFLPELSYHLSSVRGLRAPGAGVTSTGESAIPAVDYTHLSRMVFAVLLLAAWACWSLGAAVDGQLKLRAGWLLLAAVLLAGLGAVSAYRAADQRAAVIGWIEQVALLAAALTAAQVCSDRRRFALLAAVLASVAAVLALKGLYQVTVELPETIAAFEAHKAERLADQGLRIGSAKAMAFENRLRSGVPTGFGGLANIFASLLIVGFLTAVGVVWDKFVAAGRDRRATASQRGPGEIHVGTIAAVISALMLPVILAVLLLTRSRGGIASCAVAFVVAGVALAFRRRLRRHWRACALTAGGLLLAGIVATVAWGATHDRLPTQTMTFRWYYWTASAQIVHDEPLWGVGPGNFGDAYLRYRRAAAEESVKTPHNVILHALTQYGVLGGAVYLAALVGVVLAACRLGRDDNSDSASPKAVGGAIGLFAAAVVALPLARYFLTDWQGNSLLLLLDGVFPAMVLIAALAIFAWWMPGLSVAGRPAVARVMMAAGVAGMLLHNMVSFSLWTPGPATVFWIAAGACIAQTVGRQTTKLSAWRWPVAVLSLAAVVVGVLLAAPVARRTERTEAALAAWSRGQTVGALELITEAADADPQDAQATADAATMFLAASANHPARLERAMALAEQAILRNPARAEYAKLAADIALQMAPPRWHFEQAADFLARAVTLDPMAIRLRLQYARVLCDLHRPVETLKQLDAVGAIDAALNTESTEHLTPVERREAAALRRRAEGMSAESR